MSAKSAQRIFDTEWADGKVYLKRRFEDEDEWVGEWFTVEEAGALVADLQSAIRSAKGGRR